MNKLSEGRKMFLSVMAVFVIYALIFILFEDYDRKFLSPFDEASDWHLLVFSIIVMCGLAVILYRYAHRMDARINRDQDEQRTLQRRQLTQNISHELKTPVSSILGFTETILDDPTMDMETQRQFVERTHVQALRLTALLTDIATLNRMDYAADVISTGRVDVSAIVAGIVQETAPALSKKGMTMSNCLPENISIRGNDSLIYSLFRNLVDNAVNYAGQGAQIELTATEQPGQWQFCFRDNGVGVPPEHLPHLFERFYRVDKGRSRSMGGTGLGLAIVKNAIQWHGGTVTASLSPSGGLSFDFNLMKDHQ
ncbi:MAG: hypothetical protein IK119_03570 [Bacteroidales bacterium]|nr:hypothetical protein [Bacteroidales bacterium]